MGSLTIMIAIRLMS